MLPEKPWRLDALLRLAAGILTCMFACPVAASIIKFFGGAKTHHSVLFLAAGLVAIALFTKAMLILTRPWDIDRIPRNFAVSAGCMYGGLVLAFCMQYLLDTKTEPKVTSIADIVVGNMGLQLGVVFLICRFAHEHDMNLSNAFGLKDRGAITFAAGVIGVLVACLVTAALQHVSAVVMQHFNVQPVEQPAVQMLEETQTTLAQILFGVSAILFAPVAEEALFRGVLYPTLKKTGHPQLALFGSAAIFGAVHFSKVDFLPLTFLGVLLALLYEWTGNLFAPILTHGLFNLVNFIGLTLDLKLSLTDWIVNLFHPHAR